MAAAERFVEESARILRKDGRLIVCSVNKDWQDFHPSPLSVRYFSASELMALLRQSGLQAELYGAFPTAPASFKDHAVSFLKRTAVAAHLIPNTMKGKQLLKRVFFGKLSIIPAELDDEVADYSPWTPISGDLPNTQFKILYALGRVA